MTRARSSEGLTLVEALVALAIFGVLLGGVVPSFVGYLRVNGDTELRSGAVVAAQTVVDRLRRTSDWPAYDGGRPPVLDVAAGSHAFQVEVGYAPFCGASGCVDGARRIDLVVRHRDRALYEVATVVVQLETGATPWQQVTEGGGGAAAAIAVSPASRSFGDVPVGTSVDVAIMVTNQGDAPLEGSASVATPFSVVGSASYVLAPGASRAVTVRFTPSAVGVVGGAVAFSGGGGATVALDGVGVSAAPRIDVAVARIDFADVDCEAARRGRWTCGTLTRSITVTNVGGGTLEGRVSVSGDAFDRSGSRDYELAPGESQTIGIVFEPDEPGAFAGTASFTGGGGAEVPLSGSGVAAPRIDVAGDGDFGDVDVGDVECSTFTVENVGGGTLVGSAAIDGGRGWFSIASGGSYAVAAGREAEVRVCFAPQRGGDRRERVTLVFTGGGGVSVRLRGERD